MHRRVAGTLTGPVMKWVVLVFWLVMFVVVGFGFGSKLTEVEKNDSTSWLPSNAESTKALNRAKVFQSPDLAPATVVYQKSSGLTPADLAKAKADVAEFQKLKHVDGQVQGPIPSPDGKALETIIPFKIGSDGWQALPGIRDSIHKVADGAGMKVYVAGQAGVGADSADAFAGIDGKLLFITIGVVIVILLLTYRSPVLWILPVFSAAVALFVAQGVIYWLAKGGLTVNGQSAGILTVLVFGAGTDYALLLVARYREELRRHHDRHEAMAVALHRAGPAIFASGSTVILGMLCLLVAEMNSTKGLGPVSAVGIAVGLLVMMTLLPALLVICGRWIFWPARPVEGSAEPTASGFWANIGTRISHHPRAVWTVTALILAGFCIAATSLNATGLSDDKQFTKTVESATGAKVLAKHGLADDSQPMQIVANADQADAVVTALKAVPGIAKVAPPISKDGTAFIIAQPTATPNTPAAFKTVEETRAAVHAVPGADALVTGSSALILDINDASSHDNKVIIPLVLLVVFVILAILLRAILLPILLIATVVLSFGATLGVSALAFHHVFDYGGADISFPLFVFVFLVALGIDYNIFLMTRVREEALQVGTRRGSLIGLAATGGVITSAGLVLAGTFSVLGSIPLTFLAELGFAVAFGVLLDTIVVRAVLVTALNLDIGRHIWWPSALQHKEDVPESVEPVAASV